jgi:hypothetical protein
MTIDEYVAREIAALRSDMVQIGESYIHPTLAEKDEHKNQSLIAEIEASLKGAS